MRSISAGRGGIDSVSVATNSSRFIASIGFQRFSKPIVDIGLPDMPAPQALPEVWPGYSSTSGASVIRRWCTVS